MALRVLFIIACLAAWFLPLIISALYKLPHQGSIAVLSLLLGWTGVGWLAALVIAVGGAIRATRPPVAAQASGATQAPAPARASMLERSPAQSRGTAPPRAPGPAQPPAQASWPPAQESWPRAEGSTTSEPAPLPPAWPDDPH